jgi:hypothetical protein
VNVPLTALSVQTLGGYKYAAGTYPDLSQYWFAKYELEKRKPAAQRAPASSLEIAAWDTNENIVLKLANYGLRAASLKYHPDKGGNPEIMKRLNGVRQFVREQLKAVR